MLPSPMSRHQRIKRWFWSRFPVWYNNRQLIFLHREFERDRKRAKTKEEKEGLWHREQFEASDYCGDRETILTRRLLAKARKFYLSLEDLPIPSNQDTHWEEGHFGQRYLTSRSYAALQRAIWQARKEHWDFWLKIIGAVTGLVGTAP